MDKLENIEGEIQHLIVCYLEGSASEEEILALQKWLEESERHFSLFNQFRQDWIKAGCLKPYRTEEAWKKVEQYLSHQRLVKCLPLWRRIAGCAAIVVFILSVGYYAIHHHSDENRQLAAKENIEPGKKKAILVLSSNEQVVLGDEVGDTLLEGNTTIKKEGNTLVYGEKATTDGREEYNQLITPRGGEYSVVLADGTKVWVNAESELRYPVQFSGTERKVYLKGEAYFAVTKQANKPFIVCSDKAEVTVLGTEFNVRNYENEIVATTLVRGSVLVTDKSNASECHLRPGQQAVLGEKEITVREVEPMHFVAWKDGFFVYQDKKLDDILKELSRWYDFTFSYQNSDLKDMMLTAKLKKFDSVDRIFRVLAETGKFSFTTQGKEVTVYEK